LIKPGSKLGRLKKTLSPVAARNQRVVMLAEALYFITLHLKGKLAPSAINLIEENGIRYLSLRRRQDINEAWLGPPRSTSMRPISAVGKLRKLGSPISSSEQRREPKLRICASLNWSTVRWHTGSSSLTRPTNQ